MGFVKLGELGVRVQALEDMRNRLMADERIKPNPSHAEDRNQIEEERWQTLTEASGRISEACTNRDLASVAGHLRDFRNKMRRPGIKKALARLDESNEKNDENGDVSAGKTSRNKKERESGKDQKGNPTGECKCAQCGKTIDGSKEPCIGDALCVACALKKKVISQKDQDKKKRKKAVPPSGMGQETGGGGGYDGEPQQGGYAKGAEKKEDKGLRRRSY